MNIAYFCNGNGVHEAKWINEFAIENKVIVFCQTASNLSQTCLNLKLVKTYAILPGVFPTSIINSLSLFFKIRRIVKKENIQILHSMYIYPFSLYANWFNLKHIITTRGSDVLVDYNKTFNNSKSIKEYIIYSYYKYLINSALEKSTYITCTSALQRSYLEPLIKNPNKISVIRTGINDAVFKNATLNLPDTSRHITIFSPRLMKPIYNIEKIIKAFFLLKKEIPNVSLIQINDNPSSEYSNKINQLIKDYDLAEDIEMMPLLNQSELITIYNKSHIIVMIPNSDGTPNSALEAMLLKRSVIVGNCNYDKDLFNNDTVWQINTNSAIELKNMLMKVSCSNPNETINILNEAYNTVKNKATLSLAISKISFLYNTILKD